MKMYTRGMRLLVALLCCVVAGGLALAQDAPARTTIPASVFLDSIRQSIAENKAVSYSDYRVECQQGEILDFSKVANIEGTEMVIPVQLRVVNSEIACVVIPLTRPSGSKIHFQRPVNFTNTVFLNDAIFANHVFEDNVNFYNTTFVKGTNFDQSEFSKIAGFELAAFAADCSSETSPYLQCTTTFTGTLFRTYGLFSGAKFNGNLEDLFRDTHFQNKVAFVGSQFHQQPTDDSTPPGKVSFLNVQFDKEADFSQAEFWSNVQFEANTFAKPVLFRRTFFAQFLGFRGSSFDTFDLTGITMQEGQKHLDLFELTYTRLIAHDFNFDWVTTSAGPYTEVYAVDVFAKLEDNFRKQGHQTLVNEAYYHKREIECAIAPPFPHTFVDCLLSRLVGHLVRLTNVLTFAASVIVIFGLIFYIFAARRQDAKTETVNLSIASQALGGAPSSNLKVVASAPIQIAQGHNRNGVEHFIEAFSLSFHIFVSLRLVKSESSANSRFVNSILAPLLVNIEWIIGLYALLVLAATLANTIPLLGTLLAQLR